MTRTAMFSDAQWARIAPLMPSSDGHMGHPFRDHRQVVEGIVFRYRAGIPWRDLPECFGPWQTVWKRHRRLSKDGTWDRIHTPAPRRGRRVRRYRLVSRGGLHDQPRASARHEPRPRHGGTYRITRICALSPAITPWAAPAAGCPRRSTTSPTVPAGRWSSSSAQVRPVTARCFPVNGQFVVPAGGQVKVPSPGLFSWC